MKRLLSIFIALLSWSLISAANVLSIGQYSGSPGDTVEVSVSLSTTSSATALQVVIPLSDQLTYLPGSASLNGGRLAATGHQITASSAGGNLTMLVYSSTNAAIPTGAGAVITFRLRLGNEPATYPLSPVVVLSDAQAQKLTCSAQNGQVQILGAKIAVSATSLDYGHVAIRATYTESIVIANSGNQPLQIGSINSSSASWTPASSSLTIAAGATKSLTISYSPLLHGAESGVLTLESNAVNGNQQIQLSADPYSVNELHASSASAESGAQVDVLLSMNNMEEIVAMQCVLMLPDGLSYVEGSAEVVSARANGHIAGASVSNGQLSLLVYSPNNTALAGNDGDVLRFSLQLTGPGGTYPLSIAQAILSNRAGVNMLSASTDASIRIFGATISCETAIDLGRIPVEHPYEVKHIVQNAGEADLLISRIGFADSLHCSLLTTLPMEIGPGKQDTVRFLFAPNAAGDFESVMQLYSNDPDMQMLPIPMSATVYESNYLELTGEKQGNTYLLSIGMHNTTNIVALQMDIHWLETAQLAADSIRLSQRAANHALAFIPLGDGVYRLFIYSLSNATFASHEGELLSCSFALPSDLQIHGSTITIDNVIMSTSDNINATTQPELSLRIITGLMGDVNDDGLLTITDAVAVINFTLELPVEGFHAEMADMNADGELTVIDAVLIIQQILNN